MGHPGSTGHGSVRNAAATSRARHSGLWRCEYRSTSFAHTSFERGTGPRGTAASSSPRARGGESGTSRKQRKAGLSRFGTLHLQGQLKCSFQKATVAKYRERWDKVKESQRRKKAAMTSPGNTSVRETISEEPEEKEPEERCTLAEKEPPGYGEF